MTGELLLVLAAGVIIGLAIAPLSRKALGLRDTQVELPPPTLTDAICLSNGNLQVDGSTGAYEGLTLNAVYAAVFPTGTTIPSTPPAGATQGSNFPLIVPMGPGMVCPTGGVVGVWAEYEGYSDASANFPFGSSSSNASRLVPAPVSVARLKELEAIPVAYRFLSDPESAGATSGPAAELIRLLTGPPGAILEYVSEVSFPGHPIWRCSVGSKTIYTASLKLDHRPDGFGAVMTVVFLIGGRQVQLTWSTHTWQLNDVNRLISQSNDAPALRMGPA